jgi:hypothetical protein
MAGKSAYMEQRSLGWVFSNLFLSANASASNTSTTSILVDTSAGFAYGDVIWMPDGTYALCQGVPDATHINVTPAQAVAPTTGTLDVVGYSSPVTIYLGLFTAAPTDAGGGTEVSGGNYGRVYMPVPASWTLVGGNPYTVRNAIQANFGAPSANWGVITHLGIFDAATGGNLLYWAALTTPKTVNALDPGPKFPINSIVITED